MHIVSVASMTRGPGRTCGRGTGTGLRGHQQTVETEVRGELTKVWLVGAALELDSSGAGLYQEMSHQLMGQVPWDTEKEMRTGHFSWRLPTNVALSLGLCAGRRWEKGS